MASSSNGRLVNSPRLLESSETMESFVDSETETTLSFVSSFWSMDVGLLSVKEVVVSSSMMALPFRGPWLLSSEVVGSRESPFWWTSAGALAIELPFSRSEPAKIPGREDGFSNARKEL